MDRLSPAHLFEDQFQVPSSPLYAVVGALFVVLLVSSFYVYIQAPWRYAHEPARRHEAYLYAILVGSFSGLGLAAAIFAFLTVPFLSKRIWLVIALIGLLGTACRGALAAWRNRTRT